MEKERSTAGSTKEGDASVVDQLSMVGASAVFHEAMQRIRKFATCDATVLIHGETGTGKELAARAIRRTRSGCPEQR